VADRSSVSKLQAREPRHRFSPFRLCSSCLFLRPNQPSLLAPQTVFVREGAHNATYFQPITRFLTKTSYLVQWLSTYQLCCGVADQRGGRSFTRRSGTRSLHPFHFIQRGGRSDQIEKCVTWSASRSFFPRSFPVGQSTQLPCRTVLDTQHIE